MGNRLLTFLNGNNQQDSGHRFWLGQTQKSFHTSFPSCSDELIDWTAAGSQMFKVYLKKGVSKRKKFSDAGTIERGVTFSANVLRSETSHVNELASLNALDRLKFFAENVVVSVTAPDRPPAILTVQEFVSVYLILLRYFELLSVLKDEAPEKQQHHCLICLNEDSQMVVLPCTHSLCSSCSKRWVSRRLTCPFCRHQHQSPSKNQWEVLEWQTRDAVKDVVRLENLLDEKWKEFDFSPASKDLLATYENMERTLAIWEEEGLTMVGERQTDS